MNAVIFDMDGVLIDSEPLHHAGSRLVFAKMGHKVTQEIYNKTIGTTMNHSMQIYKKEFGLPQSIKELTQICEHAFLEELKQNLKAKDGVFQLLKQLKQQHIKIGLASSTTMKQIDIVLNGLGIKDCFNVIVSGEEFKESKPHPRIYIETAKRLDVPADRCVVVEDSYVGLCAAKSAGMQCVVVKTAYTKDIDSSKADHVVDSLVDFNMEWV
jgi:beta-phosphoglucomutase